MPSLQLDHQMSWKVLANVTSSTISQAVAISTMVYCIDILLSTSCLGGELVTTVHPSIDIFLLVSLSTSCYLSYKYDFHKSIMYFCVAKVFHLSIAYFCHQLPRHSQFFQDLDAVSCYIKHSSVYPQLQTLNSTF